MTTYYLIY